MKHDFPKRIALTAFFVVLLALEALLLLALLPASWQPQISPVAHDQWSITHPALDAEISQALRDNRALAIGYYGTVLLLLALNTAGICLCWARVRSLGRYRRTFQG